MIQFLTIAIVFCFVTPTSNRVSTMNDFQSYIVRSTSTLYAMYTIGTRAWARYLSTSRRQRAASNGSLNWIIVSVNVDIHHKSYAYTVSERDGGNARPAQEVAARSQKRRAFIFCRVCHGPRRDWTLSFFLLFVNLYKISSYNLQISRPTPFQFNYLKLSRQIFPGLFVLSLM